MEHFIAYHSAQKMAYELESSGELRFLSRKFGVLKKAVGNTVWVVQGIPDGKKTALSLCGAYVADRKPALSAAQFKSHARLFANEI